MCSGLCQVQLHLTPGDSGVCLSSEVQTVLQYVMEGQNGSVLSSQGDPTK